MEIHGAVIGRGPIFFHFRGQQRGFYTATTLPIPDLEDAIVDAFNSRLQLYAFGTFIVGLIMTIVSHYFDPIWKRIQPRRSRTRKELSP